MYCPKCGKNNPDGYSKCIYCGKNLYGWDDKTKNSQPVDTGGATGVGIIMALFLGLIGLLIGFLVYSGDEYKRNAFLSAWVKTFIATILIAFVIVGIVMCGVGCIACSAY